MSDLCDIPPYDDEFYTYLSAFVDGEFVGIFVARRLDMITAEVHSLLLAKGLRYSRKLGILFRDWVFTYMPVARMESRVLEPSKKALNYDKRMGASVEGFMKDSALKNGKLVGTYIVGLTRADWEKVSAKEAQDGQK
jgi:RimJ/RimL family protein N-acetyltransferase